MNKIYKEYAQHEGTQNKMNKTRIALYLAWILQVIRENEGIWICGWAELLNCWFR